LQTILLLFLGTVWEIQGICTYSGKPIEELNSCLDFCGERWRPARHLNANGPAGSNLQLVASSCTFVYIACFLSVCPVCAVSCLPNWSSEVGG